MGVRAGACGVGGRVCAGERCAGKDGGHLAVERHMLLSTHRGFGVSVEGMGVGKDLSGGTHSVCEAGT